jgi:hypothetical protein
MARPLSDAEVLLSVGFADYAAVHAEDEIVVYLNTQLDPPYTALIRLPRRRLAEERRRGRVPFFRHGQIMRVVPHATVPAKRCFGLQECAA